MFSKKNDKSLNLAIRFLIFIWGGLNLCGCTTIFYAPNSHNVPQFEKKGELKLSGGVACLPKAHFGYEYQAAYSPVNKIAVMVNAFTVKDGLKTRGVYYTGHLIEGGLGYYSGNRSGEFSPYKFEAFAGYGKAFLHSNSEFSQGYNFQYSRAFVQPGISKNWDHGRIKFSFIYSLRMVYFHRYVLETTNTRFPFPFPSLNNTISLSEEIEKHPQLFKVEPALTFRYGTQRVAIQNQIVYLIESSPVFIQYKGIRKARMNMLTSLVFSF